MKLPRAAWWVIAPASWVWQYVVYVPVYVLLNLAIAVIHVFGTYPGRCTPLYRDRSTSVCRVSP